jgi:HD domain
MSTKSSNRKRTSFEDNGGLTPWTSEALSRDEWQRAAAAATQTGPVKTEFPPEVTQRLKGVCWGAKRIEGLGWQGQPGCEGISQRFTQGLELIADIYQRLKDPFGQPGIDFRLALSILADAESWLQQGEYEFRYFEQLLREVPALEAVATKLLHDQAPTAHVILELAERQMATVDATGSWLAYAGGPGNRPADYLLANGVSFPSFGVQGLSTAWLAAWISKSAGLWPYNERRDLVAAALFQDIGLWAVRDPMHEVLEMRRTETARWHPAMGAAAISRLGSQFDRVAIMIGQHHERLSGGGEPRRLPRAAMGVLPRWLSLVVRLVELLARPLQANAGSNPSRMWLLTTGLALLKECRRGEFDESMASEMLDTLKPGISQTIIQCLDELRVYRADGAIGANQQRAGIAPHFPTNPAASPRKQVTHGRR